MKLSGILVAVAGSTLAVGSAFGSAFIGNLAVVQYEGTSAAATVVSIRDYTATLAVASFNGFTSFNSATSGLGARALTGAAASTSEGFIRVSRDSGHKYFTVAGYDAVAGTGAIAATASATTNRTIGRYELSTGNITYTAINAYSASNIRSVVTQDGSAYWTGGTSGTASTAGVRYFTHDTVGVSAGTQLSASPASGNTRSVNIFNGNLYDSANSGTNVGIGQVSAAGLPTTTGQTNGILAGPVNPASAYDFYFASSSVLYVADDSAVASGGGLQKWIFNSGSGLWEKKWTLDILDVGGNPGLRGLTGDTDASGNVYLFATTATAAPNKLVSFGDTLASTALPGGAVFTSLATSAAGTTFRGVELVPAPGAGTLLALGGLMALRRRR